MEFFRFLRRESDEFGAGLLWLGGFVGVVNGIIVYVLTTAADKASQGQQDLLLMVMALLCMGAYCLAKKFVLDKTKRSVEEVVENVRRRIVNQVRRADLESFELLGSAPLLNVVSSHTVTISQAATLIMNASTSLVLFVGAMLFVKVLSQTAFYVVVGSLALMTFLFVANRRSLMGLVEQDSIKDNDFVEGFRHLLEGFKELKMDSQRSQDFFENYLAPLATRSRESKTAIGLLLNKCTVIANVSLFVVLAAVIFLIPVLAPDEVGKILPVSAVVLFVFGSLAEIVAVYPMLTQAVGSIREIDRVEERLVALVKSSKEHESSDEPALSMQRLEMKGVSYFYHDAGNGNGFGITDLDLKIKAGEILFIVGGNGSGKSTLMKVLAGLYPPAEGELRINGKLVGNHNRQAYRNLFSSILSDFHLFPELFGMDDPDAERLQELIRIAELRGKTDIEDRRITNLDLSSGQRKRLALVLLLLEKKPVVLFDEWAAEQDPEFRKCFYLEILPELKKQGKAVIAITHDDRYFSAADRVVTMEYGRIVSS